MALVSYSSSSDSESDVEPSKPKIPRLPLPSAISCMNKVIHAAPKDDQMKHDGRIRSFEHERGNWAALVYIPVDLNIIDDIQIVIQNYFKNMVTLKCTDNIHVSLTKTVILRHHWIKAFVKSIEDVLIASEHFPLDFQSLNVYTNEERTRTFIGLNAGDIYFEKLHNLMLKMDVVMNDFRLETFYENPSFHASILWCVGDHEKSVLDKLDELNKIISEMRNSNTDDFRIRVNAIQCKAGNRSYTFKLK